MQHGGCSPGAGLQQRLQTPSQQLQIPQITQQPQPITPQPSDVVTTESSSHRNAHSSYRPFDNYYTTFSIRLRHTWSMNQEPFSWDSISAFHPHNCPTPQLRLAHSFVGWQHASPQLAASAHHHKSPCSGHSLEATLHTSRILPRRAGKHLPAWPTLMKGLPTDSAFVSQVQLSCLTTFNR